MDVPADAGKIRFDMLRASGIDFALLCAGRGRKGMFHPAPEWTQRLMDAEASGMAAGVYHQLGAEDAAQALAEADGFLRCILPYREKIRLWVCCRAERDLFSDPERAQGTLYAFLRRVQAAGFSPMLGAPPELLRILSDNGRSFPLWLLYWNVPEYRAMQFCPRIWQYDSGFLPGIGRRFSLNRGYFGTERIQDGVYNKGRRDTL
jgi:GH25 family lysozyme M1 (1,4-beta-N-acetylmuramidase)